MSRFKKILLSPIIAATVGGLSAIAYVIFSDAFDRITYAMSYAAGQAGIWTAAQSQDFINQAIANNVPSLILPVASIVGITVTLILLQREFRH